MASILCFRRQFSRKYLLIAHPTVLETTAAPIRLENVDHIESVDDLIRIFEDMNYIQKLAGYNKAVCLRVLQLSRRGTEAAFLGQFTRLVKPKVRYLLDTGKRLQIVLNYARNNFNAVVTNKIISSKITDITLDKSRETFPQP